MKLPSSNKRWIALALVFLLLGLVGIQDAASLVGSGQSGTFALNTRYVSGLPQTADLPRADSLLGAVPNPFNPRTLIRFETSATRIVDLRIYDVQGRLVRTLLAGESFAPGTHEVPWDGRDETGAEAATGVYLSRFVTEAGVESRRMTLIR
jgi:hypothetical protein